MSTVMGVAGPIEADHLGRTLVHEHIVITYPGEELDRSRTWKRADTVAVAIDRMAELLDAGFRTFVDPCPIELGRDPELYAEIAQRTGMQIVCTTGFYTEHNGIGLPVYWRARDPEEIAELYVSELVDGIGGTGIRPGAIKAATGVEVTAAERRALSGAALAHRETGAAIITHTEHSQNGAVQQEVFAEYDADPARILIGHQDEEADLDGLRTLVKGGTFVGVDRIGLEMLAPDSRRADHVAALVLEGFAAQVCLSQDHVCTLTAPRSAYWVPPERRTLAPEVRAAIKWQVSGRPYTYLLTDFVPMLVERGVTADQVEIMLVDNPRQLLTGCRRP
jgi:phosphotriesterase-related protein